MAKKRKQTVYTDHLVDDGPGAPMAPQRVMKGHRTWVYDLFKLKVASDKYNVAPSNKDPVLVSREHCHWFRTKDKRGRENTVASFQAGHTHDVEVSVGPDGKFQTKCGPAYRKVWAGPRGRKSWKKLTMKYVTDTGDGQGLREVADDHTHELEYIHSEELSEAQLKQRATGAHEARLRQFGASGTATLPGGAKFQEA